MLYEPWAQKATPQQLRQSAMDYFGACDDGSFHPNNGDWTYEILDLSIINPPPEGWEEWWKDEVKICHQEPLLAHRLTFPENPPNEAITVSIDDGKVQLWDGWHRVGSSIVTGRTHYPAIVGRRKLLTI